MAITDFPSTSARRRSRALGSRCSRQPGGGLARVHALSDVAEARSFLDERIPSLLLFDLDAPSGIGDPVRGEGAGRNFGADRDGRPL
jgi:hypothetical protein